ncbi:MAG: hypothetical protein WCR98_07495 [Saccharofermentanales bacterium]|jgi:hypothetical protein|nr:GNAT family acetyltransferase [Eubacteriales bacterium]
MDNITYRLARYEDLPQVSRLQERYHVDSISAEDKVDGFVTTLFTEEQFKRLITDENGLSVALDGDKLIAYAMAASWQYWSEWPFFQKMIADLPEIEYLGQVATVDNSYQYGPICIDKAYRGSGVLENLFDFSRETMKERYPILLTFVNQANPRSITAHKNKLHLDVLKEFQFNNNDYFTLGFDTQKSVFDF